MSRSAVSRFPPEEARKWSFPLGIQWSLARPAQVTKATVSTTAAAAILSRRTILTLAPCRAHCYQKAANRGEHQRTFPAFSRGLSVVLMPPPASEVLKNSWHPITQPGPNV